MRYEAPEIARPGGRAARRRRPARRACWPAAPICWCRCATDMVDPELIVDIKRIAEMRQITEEARRLPRSAPPSPAPSSRSTRAQDGLARRGRGRQPDRLDPGPGPRHPGRQPVQRLAGRRQRAGADRGRRHGHDRRARRAGATCRSRTSCSGPRKLALAKGEIVVVVPAAAARRRARATPTCASSRAPRWTSPWSACGVSLTLDAGGIVHRRARVALGAVAPTRRCWSRRPPTALIGSTARRRRAASSSPRPRAPPASRSTTSAAPSSTAPRSPACSPRRTAADRARTRERN